MEAGRTGAAADPQARSPAPDVAPWLRGQDQEVGHGDMASGPRETDVSLDGTGLMGGYLGQDGSASSRPRGQGLPATRTPSLAAIDPGM